MNSSCSSKETYGVSDSDYLPSLSQSELSSTEWDRVLNTEDSVLLSNNIDDLVNVEFRNDFNHDEKNEYEFNPFIPDNNIDNSLTALEIYKLFITDDLIDASVISTNTYAQEQTSISSSSVHDYDFETITARDIWLFIGIKLYMGLVRLPALKDYWSRDPLYDYSAVKKIMTRNKFEVIWKNLHFNAPGHIIHNSKLKNLEFLVSLLNERFNNTQMAQKTLVIDESLVAWKGRLAFKQYIPGKAHKYGVKIFKLTDISGYVFSLKVYTGKDNSDLHQTTTTPFSIVTSLMSHYLNRGHLLVTDNFYTSIELAKYCIENRTNLIGTVRKNKRFLPLEFKNKRLSKGSVISLINNDSIRIMKWRDKRDVIMLSTCYGSEMTEISPRFEGDQVRQKPRMIIEYNKSKFGVDISDQLTSYYDSTRKGNKWDRKVATNLILNVVVANSFLIKRGNRGRYSLKSFTESLIKDIFNEYGNENHCIEIKEHKLIKNDEVRKRCKSCYNKYVMSGHNHILKKAANNKIATYCQACSPFEFQCLLCFADKHTSYKRGNSSNRKGEYENVIADDWEWEDN